MMSGGQMRRIQVALLHENHFANAHRVWWLSDNNINLDDVLRHRGF